MKILNPNFLPDVLVRAAVGDYIRNPDANRRMSVTDLINPPLIRSLKLKHWDEIEQNIDDMAWSLFGKAFHDLMNKYAPPGASSEYKIEHYFDPYVIIGQPDVHKGGILDDYKVTSVWSFAFGDKPEWEAQLNVYAWLLAMKSVQISELRIIAILRDWVKTKSMQHDYPNSPFHVVNIPLWDINKQAHYVGERVAMHQNPKECTPEDKWQREDSYAVKSVGVKKARRVLATEEEAILWATDNMKGKYEIEKRDGEKIRCKFYCPARTFCPYNKETESEVGAEADS
jgi:hypothetical protein